MEYTAIGVQRWKRMDSIIKELESKVSLDDELWHEIRKFLFVLYHSFGLIFDYGLEIMIMKRREWMT